MCYLSTNRFLRKVELQYTKIKSLPSSLLTLFRIVLTKGHSRGFSASPTIEVVKYESVGSKGYCGEPDERVLHFFFALVCFECLPDRLSLNKNFCCLIWK